MRNIQISVGEYYHILNRGVNKQIIFHDKNDYSRFLFLILYFQSPVNFQNIGRISKDIFVQHSVLNIDKIIKDRYVELISFCLMSNHFHLIVKEEVEGGISQYMQRVLNAYTKYFNKKYQKSGHLFQGPYKAIHIIDDTYLLHLSAYIHRNPREIKDWFKKEEEYLWSSYQDFIKENRWNNLLVPNIILEQFKNKEDYKKFVNTSTTKIIEDEIISEI
ncbi:MAG: transposase [Candidatus Nomurabacteria bacterium]|nr:transposase [Candidatus Nomurabacteria bacterium]